MNDIAATDGWLEANQRYLAAEFARLRALLDGDDGARGSLPDASSDVRAARIALPRPAAIDRLAEAFALSPFERDLTLLLAAREMGAAGSGPQAEDPAADTVAFSRALARLPDAHWSALAPDRPLRRWRLVELGPGWTLRDRPLRLEERVLHFLAGIDAIDERLRAFVREHPVPARIPAALAASCESIAESIGENGDAEWPLIQIAGDDRDRRADAAAVVAATFGLSLYRLHTEDIPAAPAERDALATLWQRDAALAGAALLLDGGDDGIPARAVDWLDTLEVPRFVATRGDAPGLPRAQRCQLPPPDELEDATARTTADAGLRDLESVATRVDARPAWSALVVPQPVEHALRAIVAQMRLRPLVEGKWGMASRHGRAEGVAVLFCGGSGTGKTLAAEVVAGALGAALYRIDLASMVSKYIGETERNLRRVFDAAEGAGAILLFDEADALFGKRSEVRDSHDRYANIQVSYLLQRIEAYGGLAVLTTNARSAIDRAFHRRLRFVVEFPFPDAALRERIWRNAFPPQTPVESLDFARLARLEASGGAIRNISLAAAYLAAAEGGAVSMRHLAAAARAELAKSERTAAETVLRGWE